MSRAVRQLVHQYNELAAERGRAPGKANNPLGDQINWEQLLTKISTSAEAWIISRDPDYCYKYADTVVLNPALYQELIEKRPRIKLHCFIELEKVQCAPGAGPVG
jgi:hypothetical protein